MDIKFTDMDVVDTNIVFSREYLTKARASIGDNERMLKLLILANQSINNAINQIENTQQKSNYINKKCPSVKQKS
jgi:hypothetical protein